MKDMNSHFVPNLIALCYYIRDNKRFCLKILRELGLRRNLKLILVFFANPLSSSEDNSSKLCHDRT